jgi:CheY-like chemotaxis protein/anti-sigma regulatory factor (Ser/Thr protein kinase)
VRRFSLSEVVEHSVIWIQEYAARHRLEVTLDIDPRLGMVEGDERKIKQVLANLLSNAVKFTPDGGCVEVCVRRVSDEAHVTVRDTGIGIAASDQDRIFSPFEQGSGRMPAYNEGTGLGLAISRRLVELHGGRIWVESTPGVGSSFTFAIPLGQPSREAVVPPTAQQHEEPGADTLDHWHAPPPLQPPGSPATGISTAVLVIDNHPMAIEVVEAVLAPEGYRVISSLGGEAGLDLAGRERPNLIILDLIMPDLDGFTVVRKLRENPGTAGIPVIVLTSKALSTEERAQLAGQVSHLGQKGDFDRAAFVELVRRHTSR